MQAFLCLLIPSSAWNIIVAVFVLAFAAEIPEFLSEEECGVVVRLAQLKGLMESQVVVPEGQEELNQQLKLTPEEIFNFLDLNQDGQLQPHEVCWQSSVSVEP